MLKINQLLKNGSILTFICLLAMGFKVNAQQHPFKVLIVASHAKDHLKMIAAANPFFEELGQKNGFDVDFTDDTSKINDDNLAKYQVFVMLQLAPFDMSYSQQAALQKFAEQGKGWVGIHAAGLTGKEFLAKNTIYWQWFEDFMGGVLYSPHPAFQKAKVVVEDHNHPVTIHLPATFEISDEWYEWDKSPRGNSNVRVLASVDESTYKQNKPMGDHPVIWTNESFRRMIYISIGHSPEDFTNQNYVTLMRDAIVWAASK
jgi:type 1 glutamine amidotransferase